MPPAEAPQQGQIFVQADSPLRVWFFGAGVLLAIAATIVLAVVALGSGADSSTTNVTKPSTPGPIPRDSVPAQVAPSDDPEVPATQITNISGGLSDVIVQSGGNSTRVTGLDPTDAGQVTFVAGLWAQSFKQHNLGAFCIFLTDRFRQKLTGQTSFALSNCVQGKFRKLRFGPRVLPLRNVRGAGRRARVTFPGGHVATLVKEGASWKVNAFR